MGSFVNILNSAVSLASLIADEEEEWDDDDSDYETEQDNPDSRPLLAPKAERRVFKLSDYTVNDSKTLFRFSPEQIETIAPLLRLPEHIDLGNRVAIDRIEALCILLYRLSYPCRLVDVERHFQRDESICSRIITKVCVILYSEWKTHLELHPSINQAKIVHYSNHVTAAWPQVDGIYGFIDGSKHMQCRPSKDQEIVYSGHKRGHCCNWQAVVFPDGLILSLFGPVAGSVNDITMLADSGLMNKLNQLNHINGKQYSIFGDGGYFMRLGLTVPYKQTVNNPLTGPQKAFNKCMSKLRVCVENSFAIAYRLWAYPQYKKQQKMGLQPTGLFYAISMLSTNVHTCVNGKNQISTYFGCHPMTVEEYLS